MKICSFKPVKIDIRDKHVLNCLLPAKTERTYQLRNRRHNTLFATMRYIS